MEHIRTFTKALEEYKLGLILLVVILLALIGCCLAILFYADREVWDFVKYFMGTVGLFFLVGILYVVLKALFKEYLS
jgi:hypothetical protein